MQEKTVAAALNPRVFPAKQGNKSMSNWDHQQSNEFLLLVFLSTKKEGERKLS